MCAGRVDLTQRPYERSEIDRRPIQIVDRPVGVLAGQPLVDRPFEGVALSRLPHRQLHRNRERQVRRELRQPTRLLRRLFGCPSDARQPCGQGVPEPIDVVSVPYDTTGSIASLAQCGNCPASRRRTSEMSVSTSSACILGEAMVSSLPSAVRPSVAVRLDACDDSACRETRPTSTCSSQSRRP